MSPCLYGGQHTDRVVYQLENTAPLKRPVVHPPGPSRVHRAYESIQTDPVWFTQAADLKWTKPNRLGPPLADFASRESSGNRF